MKILNNLESKSFDNPPKLNANDRKKYFSFPKEILEYAKKLRSHNNQVGFLLSFGYFRVTGKFYSPSDFYETDLSFVSNNLEEEVILSRPRKHRNEKFILNYFGVRRFEEYEEELSFEILKMVKNQQKPKLIFFRCVDLLRQNKVEIPSCRKLTLLILSSITNYKRDLSEIIQKSIPEETKTLLDDLFVQEADSRTSRYRLTLLKKISQSCKPTKVKERIEDLNFVSDLYNKIQPILEATGLKHEGIKYFAGSVLKSQIFQLNQRADEDRYIHVICFIAHQYFRLQDNLVDVLLSVVRTFQNTVQREYKDICYDQRKKQTKSISNFLDSLDKNVFALINQIRSVSLDNYISDSEKVKEICELLKDDKCEDFKQLKDTFEEEITPVEYFKIMESKSIRLQNRVSPIIKSFTFQAEPGANDLVKAINYFKEKDGLIKSNAPTGFLDKDQLKATVSLDDKINPSLYKAFLFIHIANAVKSGLLNLTHSYKYRPLDDYMISKERWEEEKKDLLKAADLDKFTDVKEVLKSLDKDLFEQYKLTNKNISSGNNIHFKPFPAGGFRIATPALEEKEKDPLQGYFPDRHFVPLTEILHTVNHSSRFIDQLQHHQQKHTHKSRKPAMFASLMGLGCGIGSRKMAQISNSIKENEIEHIVNWYLSRENLLAANDAILKVIDNMELPNIYRKNRDKLHTSSDGQKFTIQGESLNANYAFKYGGKEQVVAAYSFIDERGLLWYSRVFSAAERESAYVIDGLMHNDVVKSDIHSTDTHGYSEVIFGTTHLLGFSYAPRIKNLKKQTLYIFKSRKNNKQKDWSVRPSNYINEGITKDNWDDLLRLACTIKLKETTASDIFRRLNSYSKQHDLYKAMKAFGQIIKSKFILQYLNDLGLRQSIEKQLNRVELANKFTRAVAVGNPREFTQTNKEEQEVAESCNRLIKNAIICWNYMYLTQKLKRTHNEENRERLLTVIKNHSPISWAHINLLGEYDFSEERMQDSLGVLAYQKIEAI
jgi:TnpA family transposase